jgi:hypothetical protein
MTDNNQLPVPCIVPENAISGQIEIMLSGWYDSAGLLVPDGVLQLGKKLQQA